MASPRSPRTALAGVLLASLSLFASSIAHAQWAADGAAVCVIAGTQQNVRIGSDGAGGAVLAWEDNRAGAPGLYVQRLNSAGVAQWTANGKLLSATGSRPRVVNDGGTGAIVVWRDSRAAAIGVYAQRLNSAGTEQWTAGGVRLSTTFGEPEARSDGAGGAVVAWFAGGQPTRDVYAQRVSSAGAVLWAAGGLVVCRHPQDSEEVDVCSDGSGGAIVAWQDYRGGTQRIYARRVGAAGDTLWTPLGTAVSPGTVATFEPLVAADGSGGAYITVADQRLVGLGTHLFIHRLTNAGAVQAGWPAGGVDLGECFGGEADQDVIRESTGGAIVSRDGGVVSHVTAAGAMNWQTNLFTMQTASDAPLGTVLVSNNAGGAIVGWHDLRTMLDYNTYDTQVTGGGSVSGGCPVGGEILSDQTNHGMDARGCTDGGGGAIFAWVDYRTGTGDIYALKTTCATSVGVGDAPVADASRVRLERNPSFASRRLVVELADGRQATVTLHDLAGRVVARHVVEQAGGGSAVVDLDPSHALAPGMYFVRVEHGGRAIVRKATFLE